MYTFVLFASLALGSLARDTVITGFTDGWNSTNSSSIALLPSLSDDDVAMPLTHGVPVATTSSKTISAAEQQTTPHIYGRPPLPLSNGSTYWPATHSTKANASQHVTSSHIGATRAPPGFGLYGNTTFKTICASKDSTCYQTCTSLMYACDNAHSAWQTSADAYRNSLAEKFGNGTLTTSTDTYIHTKPRSVSLSTACNTSVGLSVYTTSVDYLGVVGAAVTSILIVANPECETSSCAAADWTILSTTLSYKSPDPSTTVTHSQPYCKTWSVFTSVIPPVMQTYRYPATYRDYDLAPYPVPQPECSLTNVYGGCKFSSDCDECTISGGTVRLLYFPVSRTSTGHVHTAINRTSSSPTSLVTAVYGNTTLTSPSVYISFHTAYANNECSTQVGKRYPGAILALDPDQLSSVYGLYGTMYSQAADPLNPMLSTPYQIAASFNLADLNWPIPVSAYMNQPKFALGGDIFSIIYDDYKPVLAVPPQIRSLDPAWEDCGLDWEGLYDPPKVLHPASVAAGPLTPTADPETTFAAPRSTPSAPPSTTHSRLFATRLSSVAFVRPSEVAPSIESGMTDPVQPSSTQVVGTEVLSQPTESTTSASYQDPAIAPSISVIDPTAVASAVAAPLASPAVSISAFSNAPLSRQSSESVAAEPPSSTYGAVGEVASSAADPTELEFSVGASNNGGHALNTALTSNAVIPSTVAVPDTGFPSSGLPTEPTFTPSVAVSSVSNSPSPSPVAGSDPAAQSQQLSAQHSKPSLGAAIQSTLSASMSDPSPSEASLQGIGSIIVSALGGSSSGSVPDTTAVHQPVLTGTMTTSETSRNLGTSTHAGSSHAPSLAGSPTAVFTYGSTVYTATQLDSGRAAVAGHTITAGGPGVSVSSGVLSLGSNGDIVMHWTDRATSNDPTSDVALAVPLTLSSNTVTAQYEVAGSLNILSVAGTSLSVGGPVATVQGETISVGSSAIVVAGERGRSTISLVMPGPGGHGSSTVAVHTDATSSIALRPTASVSSQTTPASSTPTNPSGSRSPSEGSSSARTALDWLWPMCLAILSMI